jgi:four helix bundle protein
MMKATAKSFEELLVWQKAHQLVLQIYTATKTFPKEELFGVVSQIRRSAVSVPANIAEGFRRRTRADKQHFLTMAHGSLEETMYYLYLSRDPGYCQVSDLLMLAEEVSKLLTLYFRNIAAN